MNNNYFFSPLQHTSLQEIAETFNTAFQNYFVKVLLNEKELKTKIENDRIDLCLSVGVFHEKKLVGFILNGADRQLQQVYNAGTGVVPSHRGHALTQKMYDFILPVLINEGFSAGSLEVIRENTPAIYQYKKIGYYTQRNLDSFKFGKINSFPNHSIEIRKLTFQDIDWNRVKHSWEMLPAWSFSEKAIKSSLDSFEIFGALQNDNLVGYVVYQPAKRRLIQIWVNPQKRREKIGSQLLQLIFERSAHSLSVINVDPDCQSIHSFFHFHRAEFLIGQYEMLMKF